MGWVGFGQSGWVGSGHPKWTRGQLCEVHTKRLNPENNGGIRIVPLDVAQTRSRSVTLIYSVVRGRERRDAARLK